MGNYERCTESRPCWRKTSLEMRREAGSRPANLRWNVDGIAARRGRELGVAVRVSGTRVGPRLVVPVPGDGHELLIGPLRLHLRAGPLVAQVVEHINQPRLVGGVRSEERRVGKECRSPW